MASATQRALADRAIKAANVIENWCGQIRKEMEKQNISLVDDDKNVILRAKLINAMFSHAYPLAREIREFEDKLTLERIRGRTRPGI